MIFKYSEFRTFLQRMRELGDSRTFSKWNGQEKVFLLRHDVDFDIELAYRQSVIEKEEGVTATYFILTTCPTYNVLFEKNRKLLQEMVANGFEIGLHFDPTLYPEGDLQEMAQKEADILSFAIGKQVTSVSLHNPSVHGKYPMFDGFVNAYDPDFFSDESYVSDSQMRFRGKNPFTFLERITDHQVQVLLHPMHYSEEGYGYRDIMVNTFSEYIQGVDQMFKINAKYAAEVPGDLIEEFWKESKA